MKDETGSYESRIRTIALLEGQEEERKRLARELHDGVGQLLTGIRLQLDCLHNAAFNESQLESYQVLKELVLETIETVRQVSFDLMPGVLTDFGLPAALRLFSEKATKVSGVEVIFSSQGNLFQWPENLEIHLYRIVQEAVNNSLKYAKAKKIEVILTNNGGAVNLRITDDGTGFDLKEVQKKKSVHSGLNNMKLRAELMGGSFEISSVKKKGTTVSVQLNT